MPDAKLPKPKNSETTPALGDKGHLPSSTWVGIAGAVLLVLMSLSTGIGGVLMMLSLLALGTAIYALATHRRSWALLPKSRPVLVGTAVASIVMLFVGTAVYGVQNPSETTAPAAVVQSSAPTPSPTPTTTAEPAVDETPLDPATVTTPDTVASVSITDRTATATTAMALLETLPVKGRAPKTGYDRTAQFGTAWLDVDRNGCDTRNDILTRDLEPETREGVCKVITGTLNDPYTGKIINFVRGNVTSMAVQIDHVVALMNAWESGAQQLTAAQRVTLANDPMNLFAVDGPTNSQKGAGDAATWLPPQKSFRCEYVAHQVSVKATYHLWVTQAEHDAIARILTTCPDQNAYTSQFVPAAVVTPPPAVPLVAPAPAAPVPAPPAPAPKPAPAVPAPAPPAPAAYYANCSEVRAAGAAPIYPGQPGWQPKFDRDKDGVGCE